MTEETDISQAVFEGFKELHSVMKERDRRMDKLSDDIAKLAGTVSLQSQNIDRLMTTLETQPTVMERIALLEAADKNTLREIESVENNLNGKFRILFAFKDRVTWGIIGALGTSTTALLLAVFGYMSQGSSGTG